MSYNTFRIHKDAVYKKGIDIVVCDEAHQVRYVQRLTFDIHISANGTACVAMKSESTGMI